MQITEYEITTKDGNVDHVSRAEANKMLKNPPDDVILIEKVIRFGDADPNGEEYDEKRKYIVLYEKQNEEVKMKIVLRGTLLENDEHKKQITDAFKEEFNAEVNVLGAYFTLPGQGGKGGRNDVVVEIPDNIVQRAAVHGWHLSGMFTWIDDCLNNDREIIPPEALEKFYGVKVQ